MEIGIITFFGVLLRRKKAEQEFLAFIGVEDYCNALSLLKILRNVRDGDAFYSFQIGPEGNHEILHESIRSNYWTVYRCKKNERLLEWKKGT